MKHPPSRLLQRLDADIARVGECVEADCLRAEKACYLARQGRAAEASAICEEVRLRYQRRPNYSVSAWLSLSDGLIGYFGDLGLGARDKVLRAQAYSKSAGLRSIDALASAWLAQFEYSSLNIDAMNRNVRRAFANASPENHAARARASLVVAEALHYSLRFDLALPWYERSRSHALSDGDDATLSALIHNMAWLRMGAHRQSVHLGGALGDDGALALVGEASMRSFDELVGARSFKELDPLLRAQTLLLQGRVAEAHMLYESHLGDAKMAGAARWQSVFLADLAWCKASVGEDQAALLVAEQSVTALSSETQIDDCAATHSRLAMVFAAVGRADDARKHSALGREAWAGVHALQSRIVNVLSDLAM